MAKEEVAFSYEGSDKETGEKKRVIRAKKAFGGSVKQLGKSVNSALIFLGFLKNDLASVTVSTQGSDDKGDKIKGRNLKSTVNCSGRFLFITMQASTHNVLALRGIME